MAVKDIKRVLPAIIIGSAIGGALGMANGVEVIGSSRWTDYSAGSKWWVLWYFLSMLIGTLVS